MISLHLFLKQLWGKAPSNKYINKRGRTSKLTKGLKRGRGKWAPNQQLGGGQVYQKKTTQKRRGNKTGKRGAREPQSKRNRKGTLSYIASSQSKMH
jgi:hypothetical protein